MSEVPLSEISRHYDAVVVGARAAGAATAMLLARRGLRVLAVDRARYGSDTLSSHALLRGAVRRLHDWGLLDRVWAAGTPTITKAAFCYGDDVVEIDGLGDGVIPGLAAPRRTVLDPMLVDAAIAAGATVRHETRLVNVVFGPAGRVRGVQLASADGAEVLVRTDLLIGADGLRSTVADRVGAPVTRQGASASAFVLRYVAGIDLERDTYRWLFRPGLGAGVIPTNGAFCVFAALPPDRFATHGRRDPAATMAEVLHAIDPHVARAVTGGVAVGPIRCWPGARGQFRQPHGPGWALVGDAGYFKDPFAAHGICDAFRDAELLADAVFAKDLRGYELRRDELSLPVFTVLERIAGYDWDLASLPGLHVALTAAMRDEERAFAAASTSG